MINVSIDLKEILCHVANEVGGGNEPYMWTSYFYLDSKTLFSGGKKLVTYTPHANWTTRGVFPNGIQAGDIVDIPPSLGTYQVSLDAGMGMGIAAAGTLFVLIDQDSTPGDAVKAGHEAFAQAVDEYLNDYIDSVTLTPDLTISAEQIKIIADQISGKVKGAISDAESIYDIFNNQDDFIGFGYFIMGPDRLQEVAAKPYGRASFTNRIVNSVNLYGVPIVNDFEVFGRVSVLDDGRPPGEANSEYEIYKSAVDHFKSVENEIGSIIRRLQDSPPRRGELVATLAHLRREVSPLALQMLADAREAYLRSQGQGSSTSAPFLSRPIPDRIQESNIKRRKFFAQSALIAPPQNADDSNEQAES